MLLQSHAGEIHFLPALPPEWPEGSVRGLRARGGVEVDIAWTGGRATEAVLRARVRGGAQAARARRAEDRRPRAREAAAARELQSQVRLT